MKEFSIKLFIFYLSVLSLISVSISHFFVTYGIPKLKELQKSTNQSQHVPNEQTPDEDPLEAVKNTPRNEEDPLQNEGIDSKDKKENNEKKEMENHNEKVSSYETYPKVLKPTDLEASNSLISPNPKVISNTKKQAT